MFNIDLNALTGVLHLLIGLGDVFGVRRFDRHNPVPAQDAVKAGDGTSITTLHELDPEHDQPGMRVSTAHVRDEFELLRCMLVGMAVRASGTIPEGVPGAIIAVLPTIDVLPVNAVTNSSLGNAVFMRILN